MDMLMGAVLIVYSVCTFVVIRTLLFQSTADSQALSVQAVTGRNHALKRLAPLITLLIVVGMWLFQWQYRKHYSPEAKGCRLFEEVISAWEAGDRERAISIIEELAYSGLPWEQPADDIDGDLD